jgi:hypothetical protein
MPLHKASEVPAPWMKRTSDLLRKNRTYQLRVQAWPHTVFLISCGRQIVIQVASAFRKTMADGSNNV